MQRFRVICGFLLLSFAAQSAPANSAEELLQQAEVEIRAERFDAAEPILTKALGLDATNTQVLYRLGYVHYRQRKLEPARKEFGTVVKLAPPAYYSRYFLGRIALLENKPQEAVTWFEPILQAGQAVFDTAAQLAAAYTGAGMPHEAIGALQAALADAPWDASLYYRLGRLYTETNQKELAAEALENSKRLRNASREDVEVLMRVAQLLGEGKQAEALESGKQIRDRQESDPNALVALGVMYGKGNLQSEALGAFDRAAQLDANFFQAQYNRGLALLKLNRAAEALDPLSRAVELLPQSIEANRAYALAAVMNQRYQDALAPLERVWQSNENDVRIGALLATAWLRTGAPEKAAALLSGDAFRSSSEPAVLLLRVEALNATEDQEGALAAAQEAQKRFPKLPQAHLAVAQQFARLGRYQEAQPAFTETLKLAPGHPEAELGLADTLSRAGDYAGAIPHYRAAAASERTSLAARAGLARSLIASRSFEAARKVLEESIRAHPSEVSLHIELSRVYARLGERDLAAEQTRIVESLREGTKP